MDYELLNEITDNDDADIDGWIEYSENESVIDIDDNSKLWLED